MANKLTHTFNKSKFIVHVSVRSVLFNATVTGAVPHRKPAVV
jgi:hypothetical protein